MRLDYNVTYSDFLASVKAYRRRNWRAEASFWTNVFALPAFGLFFILFYLYFYFTAGSLNVEGMGYFPFLGTAFLISGPVLYRLRLRQIYKQRTAISSDGSISVELDESIVRFVIPGKVDIKYEWDTFSDYGEDDGVVTLFVQKSAFHTIPRRGTSDADWEQFMRLVTAHLGKK